MSTSLRGVALLRDPQLNKSTAFTEPEREALGLAGLVPEGIDSEDKQIQRVLLQLGQKPTDLEKYIYLSQLQDADETLFSACSCRIPRISCRSYTRRRSARPACSLATLFAVPRVYTFPSSGKGRCETFCGIGRNATYVSWWLPAASEFLDSGTLVPTAWAFRSGSWHSTLHAPGSASVHATCTYGLRHQQ